MKITTCEIFERGKQVATATADNETLSWKAHS